MLKFISGFSNGVNAVYNLRNKGFAKTSPTATFMIVALISAVSYSIFSLADPPELNFYQNKHSPDYHPDEGVWIAAGKYYFEKYFLEGDWSYETWSGPKFGAFGYRGPLMGKYVIGGWLFLNKEVERGVDIPGYSFEKLEWENVMHSRPPQEILDSARVPFKFIGVLSTVVLFLLMQQMLGSWLIALIIAVIFCLQPHVISFSEKAMNDILALLISMTALLCAERLLRNIWDQKINRLLKRMGLIGVFIGLALLTKMYNLLIIVIVCLWASIELVHYIHTREPVHSLLKLIKRHAIGRKVVLGALVMSITASITWILPNPFLHTDTVKNTARIVKFGTKVKLNKYANEDQKNNTWSRRWESLVANGPQRSGIFHYWLGAPTLVDKAIAVLGLTGLLFFGFNLVRDYQHIRKTAFITVWFVVITTGTLLWTPFDWPRWYLPMSPVWACLEGVGLFTCFFLLRKIFPIKTRIAMVDPQQGQ